MATISKQFFIGAATTNTATVLYTTPASTTSIVTRISVTSDGADNTFTLSLGGILLHNATVIRSNTTFDIDCKQVLNATNTITGGASSTAVKFAISGVEIT